MWASLRGGSGTVGRRVDGSLDAVRRTLLRSERTTMSLHWAGRLGTSQPEAEGMQRGCLLYCACVDERAA